MDGALVLSVALAFAFAVTNGVHDASNAIAMLVATRIGRPKQALLMACALNLVGPFLLGAAVADTIGGIVTVGGASGIATIGAGLTAAVAWNVFTWRLGIPSSSGHALVGGLVGAGLAEGGLDAIDWGGLDGWRPVGVFGTLIALAVAPIAGALAALTLIRVLRRVGRRATRRWELPLGAGVWGSSATLALGHGANDAQKSAGIVAALLVLDANGGDLSAPAWVTLGCAVALTAGTALGGWRIIKTVGRRIYRIRPAEGFAAQSGAAGAILVSSLAGAPVSTSQVVASSVVGVGVGRHRWHHVNWIVVRQLGLAWLVTIPATAILGAVSLTVWQAVA